MGLANHSEAVASLCSRQIPDATAPGQRVKRFLWHTDPCSCLRPAFFEPCDLENTFELWFLNQEEYLAPRLSDLSSAMWRKAWGIPPFFC